tara:strand:- start:270 stop:1172 length:903 start_codon:yes stop_codon:yes gene_type:complete
MNNYTIGIDIGGTKTSFAAIDLKKGKILKKVIIKSKFFKNDKKNLKNITQNTLEIINLIKKEYSIKINKVGIGVPELINNKGTIKGEFNFKWNNLNFEKHFKNFNIKAKADSDVRNALRGEKFFGNAKKFNNFIFVNIGTGLSYALYQNKSIYSGYNGFAIHFASSNIHLFNPKTNEYLNLIPEDYCSGKSISKFLSKLNNENSKKNINLLKSYNLKQKKYMEEIAKSLGSLIGLLINIIDPQAVILGGGVVMNNLYFHEVVKKYTRENIFAKNCKKIPILKSKLKDNAALLGAASIFKK